jgi:hypothetical protein
MRLNLPGTPIPWTKTPNVLFDQVLPTLKDTELRVLLVLLRQTSGWNREGQWATISYRTLKRRTGRQSEAIARALHALETRGLIHLPRASPQRAPPFAKILPSQKRSATIYRKKE